MTGPAALTSSFGLAGPSAATAAAAATGCLVLALGWQAALVLLDDRAVRRDYARAGVYRLGRGWTGPAALAARRRRALAEAAAAAALLLAAGLPSPRWSGALTLLCCALAAAVVLGDRAPRYTSVCLLVLLAVLGLRQVTVLATGAPRAAPVGAAASFFAAQMYLVAGIRKLRSPHFMRGGVIADNIAYNSWQAAAGSREFLPLPRLPQLAVLLAAPAFQAGCRAAAVATAATEVTLGLGALGLLPAAATVLLAVPTHLAFTAISPRRIVPFSAASLGLLLLAVTHPLLPW
ncbi:hypothetical protein [Kitasatospora viridis]|uniref:HTTM domain-containing protein n=1 Tax=Kitasatospora viridis TaxID=281105 RepID=A0A561SDG0_9ACTN|nr:hypothetical protein [Kitasatospora viridis]TWF72911.1 hypothetical protein FHX73_1662 [Kitasatospora viridis]